MSTDNSGERVTVGDCYGGVTKCCGLGGEFIGVTGAGEESEVCGGVEFGVQRRGRERCSITRPEIGLAWVRVVFCECWVGHGARE